MNSGNELKDERDKHSTLLNYSYSGLWKKKFGQPEVQ